MAIDRIKEQKSFQNLPARTKRKVRSEMDNVTINDGKVVSNKTGEDVTDRYDVVLRTTDDQIRRLKETDDSSRHQIDNGEFIFAFFEKLTTVEGRFPSLTKPDVARLMYIATFISWEENRLQAPNGRHHYTKKDVEGLVDMSSRRFREFFNRLEGENIISETDTGELFIDPTIFYRGQLRNHEYDMADFNHTRLFRKTVRELYGEFKGRRLAQLAVIYSVLPFLNFSTNIVSYNPDETSEDLIRPMELSKLATLTGYKDDKAMKRSLNNIKLDGKPVFGFFENPHDRRTFRTVVNPRVVFAGNGESLRVIRALFN